ncbi:coiled-coil domain-containing protein 187 [Pteropus alecto]|uniref:coiled-coil domain-containing protein 187 n=1 Tax=Pteropus alecto TaxID=9402 RepID=UPI000D536B2F|nr:coiled-coil domain-containing protein 187 [Pteropus alecto]
MAQVRAPGVCPRLGEALPGPPGPAEPACRRSLPGWTPGFPWQRRAGLLPASSLPPGGSPEWALGSACAGLGAMAAARSLLAASRSHVLSERSQPGQRRTPGQVHGAEPDGGRGGASMVTQLQRADTLHPPAVEDDLMATLRWPEPSAQPGPLQGGPYEAWSDHMQRPDSPGKACSYPVWTTGEEAKDEDSLVSSGRLSGSSGGHESCAPPHGPWKERAPQVLGSPRLPRQSNPRLEQLRDKIRAQVQWQASCASLATSTPSSASHLYKASSPAPRRKTRKLKHSPPAPVSPGSRVLSAAERGVEDKVLPGHGREPSPVSLCQASVPREKNKSTKNSSCRRETDPKSPTPQRATRDTGKAEDSELVGVHAWRKGAALARELLGPPPARPRLQSEVSPRGLAPSAELGTLCLHLGLHPALPRLPGVGTKGAHLGPHATWGGGGIEMRERHLCPSDLSSALRTCHRGPAAAATACDDEAGAPESTPVRARTPSPASVRGDLHMPASTPHWASCDQHVTIQSAMAILRELRQQIQTGLELARDRHVRGGHQHRLRDLTGRGHQGPWSVPGVRGSSSSPRATTEGPRSSWERAGVLPSRPRWSTLARWESYPQRAWSAQARDSSFQRPGSPHERPAPFPLRPWSALAGQRTRATCEEWGGPAGPSWNSLERRSSSTQRPWSSASFTQRAGIPCKSRGSLLPPSGAKHSWPRPAQAAPRNAPGKENEARRPPPCPKPRGFLGHPYSSESLREFMRQKARARRQQALEEKAAALQAVELRSQRLRDVHRKQREAVLGKAASGKVVPKKAFPVVSQTNPGIVTFVPHSAQCRGLEAPGSLGSPVLQWSKVTSGMVLGDQEAPGSFCLCLNRALNHAETLDTGAPQEGWDGAPLLTSAGSSQGPLRLRDLSVPTRSRSQRPGLCIYLDPEEAERLGTPGPLHFRYKHARLQALETMANILKQRIDTLTAKLLQSETADTLGDLGLDPPPSCPSIAPAAPACSGALVPNGGGGAPWGWADARAGTLLSPTCLLDGETPLWSSAWEPWQSVSPSSPLASKPPGKATLGPQGPTSPVGAEGTGILLSPCCSVSSGHGPLAVGRAPLPRSPRTGSPSPWADAWEVRSRLHLSEGFMEDGCSELDRRLARNVASFRALSPFTGSRTGQGQESECVQARQGSGTALVHGVGSDAGQLVLLRLSAEPQARDTADIGISRPHLLTLPSWPSGHRPVPHRPLALGSHLGHHTRLRALWAKGPQTPPTSCPYLRMFVAPSCSQVCLRVPSSHGVPIPPDPTCCSLWLEETPSARGAGLVTPWTTQSCGKGEPVARPWAVRAGGRGGPQGTPSTVWRCGEALQV